jgi:RNA polymerase sigma-70 factor (ECF subfamily)
MIETYQASMLCTALVYVSTRAVAEEVIQDTWLDVFRGLARFEGRSSLKTWIFRILTNTAKTRGQQEARSVPLSALADHDAEMDEPAVPPERFRPTEPWQGSWLSAPQSWEDLPEERTLSTEAQTCIASAIAALPPQQREVIRLRDIEGWLAGEVCGILGISAANQRVLLHRARSKVRGALEAYFDPDLAPNRRCPGGRTPS